MGRVASLWRHPIKSHGREALDHVALIAGQTMPWDRHWAVTHEASKFDVDHPGWAPCRSFMRGSQTPALAAIWAKLDEAACALTLTHPDLDDLNFKPDDPRDADRFLRWIAPLCPAARVQPTGIVKAPQRGMTDSPYPSVAIMNTASHTAVADKLGIALSQERWRGNIWINDLPAWAEWDWIGHDICIGNATLRVRERIKRCLHTAANPQTGIRDADTLGALTDGWGHTDFGIYAEVISGGDVTIGDNTRMI